jgi:hypothetical protein
VISVFNSSRGCWQIAVSLAAAILFTSDARASSYAPDTVMTFQVVRKSDPACEPTCPEWIAAMGSIEPYTPAAFRKLLKSLGRKRLPIVIASNGGDRLAAQELGRIIRKEGMTTAIGFSTILRPCTDKPSVCRKKVFIEGTATFSQINCVSSCVYMFAGGLVRLNSDRNVVGIHAGSAVTYTNGDKNFKDIKNAKRAAGILKKAHAEKLKYLAEMGIDPALEDEAYRHTNDVYEIPFAQQKEWKFVTNSVESHDFTDVSLCKAQSAPENCVTVEVK